MSNLSRISAMGLGALAFSLTAVQATAAGPPDEVTNWTIQPCFDHSDAGWDHGMVPWVEAIEEATEGSVQINLVPAGSLTSAGEAFSAASAGAIDGTACWATVYGGDLPEGMLAFGLAMGAANSEQAWDIMWGDPDYRVGELVQEAAAEENLYWAGWTNQGPNAMFTTFEVNDLSDFQGTRMRAGGPQAMFHEALGGSPVSMGPGEIYSAIQLGTIEGTYWDTGGIIDMSFHEVVNYAVMPGWNPAQHQEAYLNLDSWNALTDWQREQIDGVFESTYFDTSQRHTERVDEVLEQFEAAGGTIVNLSDDQIEEMRVIAVERVWPQVAERSERNAEGVELYRRYLEAIGEL